MVIAVTSKDSSAPLFAIKASAVIEMRLEWINYGASILAGAQRKLNWMPKQLIKVAKTRSTTTWVNLGSECAILISQCVTIDLINDVPVHRQIHNLYSSSRKWTDDDSFSDNSKLISIKTKNMCHTAPHQAHCVVTVWNNAACSYNISISMSIYMEYKWSVTCLLKRNEQDGSAYFPRETRVNFG